VIAMLAPIALASLLAAGANGAPPAAPAPAPAASAPAPAAAPPADPARAELDRVAARIERLKARQLAGEDVSAELERLLVRAQELAQRLERRRRGEGPAVVPPPGPTPEELREQADAMRDERDRLASQLKELDGRIEEARKERRVEAGLESLAQESSLFGESGSSSRVSPKAGSLTGPDGTPVPVEPGTAGPSVLFGPRAGGGGADDKARVTVLQRLDRLRAERARLAARIAALETSAAALDQKARALSETR
jgi:prefoldin subunit 5